MLTLNNLFHACSLRDDESDEEDEYEARPLWTKAS